MIIQRSILSIFLLFSLFLSASAEPAKAVPADLYKKGSAVAAFQAKDQHGKDYQFKKGTKYLVVTFDMSTGKKVNKQLAAKGATYLTEKKAVYVANIFGMPGIGRAFALPKMRRYPHTIILADEENLLARFPKVDKKATVLTLNSQGVVQSVSYWDPKSQKVEEFLK